MNDIKLKLRPGHKSDKDWMADSPMRHLFWNVTYACNFRCQICFSNSGERSPDELNTDEAKDMLAQARDAGVRDIMISGGEPFMREDLPEIIAFMTKLGIKARIASNGTLLDGDLISFLRNETLTRSFQISLDTLDPDLYQRIHGVQPGMLDKALKSLRQIKAHGFHTTVATRLTPETLPGIPDLLNLAADEGWATVTVHCPLHSGRVNGAWTPETDLISLLEPVFEHYIAMPVKWIVETNIPWARYHPVIQGLEGRIPVAHEGCGAARCRLALQPAGHITPCICVDTPGWHIGNVRKDKLADVFHDSPVAKAFRSPEEHGLCADCPEVQICGAGCRVAAYARTGRFDADDEACPLRCKMNEKAADHA